MNPMEIMTAHFMFWTGPECDNLSPADLIDVLDLARTCGFDDMYISDGHLVWPGRAKYTFEDGKYVRHGE